MVIDHEYLKGLLEAFGECENHQTNIKELRHSGFYYLNYEFLFHIRLLDDLKLITRTDGEIGFGYSEMSYDNGTWIVTDLRLTASGHYFLEAIRNKYVWDKVKSDFHEASIGTLVDVSKQLFDGFIKRKIDNILR